jgi:hypothetical protein
MVLGPRFMSPVSITETTEPKLSLRASKHISGMVDARALHAQRFAGLPHALLR